MKRSRHRIRAESRALATGCPSTSFDSGTEAPVVEAWAAAAAAPTPNTTLAGTGRRTPLGKAAASLLYGRGVASQSENTPLTPRGLLMTGVETGDAVACASFDSFSSIATWTGLSAAAPSAGNFPLPLGVMPHHPAPGFGLGASAQVGMLFHESRAPPPLTLSFSTPSHSVGRRRVGANPGTPSGGDHRQCQTNRTSKGETYGIHHGPGLRHEDRRVVGRREHHPRRCYLLLLQRRLPAALPSRSTAVHAEPEKWGRELTRGFALSRCWSLRQMWV